LAPPSSTSSVASQGRRDTDGVGADLVYLLRGGANGVLLATLFRVAEFRLTGAWPRIERFCVSRRKCISSQAPQLGFCRLIEPLGAGSNSCVEKWNSWAPMLVCVFQEAPYSGVR